MSLNKLANISLTTARLTIRATTEQDLADIYSIHSNNKVNRYIPYKTWQSMDDAHAWYKIINERRTNHDAEHFVLISNQKLIGTIITFGYRPKENSLELGYVLSESAWGRGLMKEALSAIISEVALTLKLSEFRAIVNTENQASAKLLSAIGFKQTETKLESDGTEILLFQHSVT